MQYHCDFKHIAISRVLQEHALKDILPFSTATYVPLPASVLSNKRVFFPFVHITSVNFVTAKGNSQADTQTNEHRHDLC